MFSRITYVAAMVTSTNISRVNLRYFWRQFVPQAPRHPTVPPQAIRDYALRMHHQLLRALLGSSAGAPV